MRSSLRSNFLKTRYPRSPPAFGFTKKISIEMPSLSAVTGSRGTIHPCQIHMFRLSIAQNAPCRKGGLPVRPISEKSVKISVDRPRIFPYTNKVLKTCGGIAQLARAHGSYPWCREFKSPFRYRKALNKVQGFLFYSN